MSLSPLLYLSTLVLLALQDNLKAGWQARQTIFICITLFSLNLCDLWRAIPVQNWISWADLKHFSLQKTKLWGAAGPEQGTAALSVPEPWKDRPEGRSLPSCCRSHSSYLSKAGKRQNKLPDPKCGIHFDQGTAAECLRTYEHLRVSEGFNCPTSFACLGVSNLLLMQKIWGIATPTLTPASG